MRLSGTNLVRDYAFTRCSLSSNEGICKYGTVEAEKGEGMNACDWNAAHEREKWLVHKSVQVCMCCIARSLNLHPLGLTARPLDFAEVKNLAEAGYQKGRAT